MNQLVRANLSTVVLVHRSAEDEHLSERLRSVGLKVKEFGLEPGPGLYRATRGRGSSGFATCILLSGTLKDPTRLFIGNYLGRDAKKVAAVLQEFGITRVTFQSELKMSDETVSDYMATFGKVAGLDAFEVPCSTLRSGCEVPCSIGWIDYIIEPKRSD